METYIPTTTSTPSSCSPDSSVGVAVSIIFGVLYAALLSGVSVYSYNFLMKYNTKFTNSSCLPKFKLWMMDTYKRRRCYIPIITHTADKITDFAVVIQFGQLAATDKYDCGINMNYLFTLSILVLLLYSTISSFLIYQSTKSCKRLMMQILDIELFRTLYINYLCDKEEPCSPQRWITSLEAAFESTPQALIQTIFLVKTQEISASPIVVVSLLFSLWSIISKIISDDKVICIAEAKYISFNIKLCKSFNCVSWLFISRYIWRILDVSSRILVCSLVWLVLGGVALTIVIIIESLMFLSICACTKRMEFLFGIVAIVISRSTEQAKRISKGLIIYRCISNIILMVTITAILYSTEYCWKCSSVEQRRQYTSSDPVIVPMMICGWITVVLAPCLYVFLSIRIFDGDKSTARNIKDMIKSEDWNGVIEMQAYKGNYGVYNDATNETLLMLAVQHNYGKLVSHMMSNRNDIDLQQTSKNDETILDYVKLSTNAYGYDKSSIINKKYMGELLLNIANECPNILTKDRKGNVLYIASYIGDLVAFEKLLAMNAFDVSDAWEFAVDGDQPDIIEHLLKIKDTQQNTNVFVPNYADLNNPYPFAEQMVEKHKPRLVDYLMQYTSSAGIKDVWFHSVLNGNIRVIKTIQKHVTTVNTTDDKGRTVFHIACQQGEDRNMQIIRYLQTVVDRKITDNRGKTANEYLSKIEIEDGKEYKITPLGSGGSDKSELTLRYVTGTYESNYDPTIEDSYRKQVMIDGHACLLNILDTAGQEEYAALQDQWIREGEIFLVMYSITSRESFDEAAMLRDKIVRILDADPDDPNIPIVLVGNKCHLEDERTVSTQEGRDMVHEWGEESNLFYEASSKEKINVQEVFEGGVRLYWTINGFG